MDIWRRYYIFKSQIRKIFTILIETQTIIPWPKAIGVGPLITVGENPLNRSATHISN
nr:MAG TPA: hypothetical protein [Caudoviricetes sp.]